MSALFANAQPKLCKVPSIMVFIQGKEVGKEEMKEEGIRRREKGREGREKEGREGVREGREEGEIHIFFQVTST